MNAVIHKGLAEAVEDDLLAVNPAVGAGTRARRAPASFTVWTEAELHAFLDTVERPEHRVCNRAAANQLKTSREW